jgi:hypothetical protein
MISQLIHWLWGLPTERVTPRAEQIVAGWTQENSTLRTLRYGWARRRLLDAADRPIGFSLLVALGCSVATYCTIALLNPTVVVVGIVLSVSARPAAFLPKRPARARPIAAACRQSAASTAVV